MPPFSSARSPSGVKTRVSLLPASLSRSSSRSGSWTSLVSEVGRGQDGRSGYKIDFGEVVSFGVVVSWTDWRQNLRSKVLVLVRFALEMGALEDCLSMHPEGRVFQSFCHRHVGGLQVGVFSDKCNSDGVKQLLLPRVCI